MRALSVHWEYCVAILDLSKPIEYRSWKTSLGDLLIVSTASTTPGKVGKAICVVEVWQITGCQGAYEWHLRNVRPVKQVDIKGAQNIYHVDDSRIVLLDATEEVRCYANHCQEEGKVLIQEQPFCSAHARKLAPMKPFIQAPALLEPAHLVMSTQVTDLDDLNERLKSKGKELEKARQELDARLVEARARLQAHVQRGEAGYQRLKALAR